MKEREINGIMETCPLKIKVPIGGIKILIKK